MTTPPPTLEHRPVAFADASGNPTPGLAGAATATYRVAGGAVFVALARTRYNRWRCTGSEVIAPSTRLKRARWRTPVAALSDLAYRTGYATLTEVGE